MTEKDSQEILNMHQFYTQEARHQRTMMWETVKWFTPILTLIGGGWVNFYIGEYLPCKNISVWWILLALSIFGICLCISCLKLLKSFYETNLIYISMFAKLEEKLNFDMAQRGPSKFYPSDEYITWQKWRDNRISENSKGCEKDKSESNKYTSEAFVEKQLNKNILNGFIKEPSILILMKSVFYFFALFFVGSIFLLIRNCFT